MKMKTGRSVLVITAEFRQFNECLDVSGKVYFAVFLLGLHRLMHHDVDDHVHDVLAGVTGSSQANEMETLHSLG